MTDRVLTDVERTARRWAAEGTGILALRAEWGTIRIPHGKALLKKGDMMDVLVIFPRTRENAGAVVKLDGVIEATIETKS